MAVGAGLGTLGLVIATTRAKLSVRTLRAASVITALASLISVIAAVAMVASVVIVATNQPSRFGGDRGGQFPPNQQAASSNQQPLQAPAGFQVARQNGAAAQAPQATPEVAPAGNSAQATPAPQSTPTVAAGAPGGDFGGGRDGRPPEGGFPPGGPGGGFANLASHYEIGGGLMAVFTVLALAATVSLLFGLRGLSANAALSVVRLNVPREVGAALLSGVVLTLVFGGLIQLVPVSHDNPPVQTTIKWDSAQTQDLATRACMDCHSNETRWPWYTSIAPMSWVTAQHVTQGRQQYNFSELNTLEGFRKQRLGEELAQQIRSGAMPPADYPLLHPDARLTDAEKQQLIDGLEKSLLGS